MLSNESASESVSAEAIVVVVCLEEELADNKPSSPRSPVSRHTASHSAAKSGQITVSGNSTPTITRITVLRLPVLPLGLLDI